MCVNQRITGLHAKASGMQARPLLLTVHNEHITTDTEQTDMMFQGSFTDMMSCE